MPVSQPKHNLGVVGKGMAFGRDPKPIKAIYAVREVDDIDIPTIYKTRGMACAVKVGGRSRLLTWQGVINEQDQAKTIKLHRSSKNFFTDQKNYRLEMLQINQVGSFSFISVKGGNNTSTLNEDFIILELRVPGSTENIDVVSAYSIMTYKEIVKFTFKYSQEKGKYELHSSDKDCIFEKSFILGSPIINDKDQVIGVVGEDRDGKLRPYFLTETEIEYQEKEPSEGATGSVPDIPNACGHDKTSFSTETVLALGSVEKKYQGKEPSEGATGNVLQVDITDASNKKYSAPVHPSDQEEGKELGSKQHEVVFGYEKTSSSTETVPAQESNGEIRMGNIPLEWFPYLALDIQGDMEWKKLGKSLDLSDAELNGIEIDNDEEYERSYKMLKTWWQKGAASYDKLASALRKHDLEEIRRDFCLMECTPPLKEVVNLPGNLKEGPIDRRDLPDIAEAVMGKCKRLGRALGVKDNRLDKIVMDNPKKGSEQSYQILRAWKQANGNGASYYSLAQALYDRTVNLGVVVSDFCLKKTQ